MTTILLSFMGKNIFEFGQEFDKSNKYMIFERNWVINDYVRVAAIHSLDKTHIGTWVRVYQKKFIYEFWKTFG